MESPSETKRSKMLGWNRKVNMADQVISALLVVAFLTALKLLAMAPGGTLHIVKAIPSYVAHIGWMWVSFVLGRYSLELGWFGPEYSAWLRWGAVAAVALAVALWVAALVFDFDQIASGKRDKK